MPLADVDVMVIMTHPGVLSYKVEGSYAHCDVSLSDAEQTGSDSLYVEPGSNVTVTASPLDGYFVENMSYTTFSDPILKTIQFTTDADGVATGTLTMPEDPVYLSVNAILFPVPCISYDSTGHLQGEQICRSYTRISSGNPTWLDFNDAYGGWYVVKNDATLGSETTIRINGDVKLILCDGATLTVGNGIYIKKGSSLSIYGQREETGKLISKPDHGPGIGGMEDTVAGSLYIHGGIIEAAGGKMRRASAAAWKAAVVISGSKAVRFTHITAIRLRPLAVA